MKLLAWNIRHGGWRDGRLAPAIAAHDPDLIVLGEFRVGGTAGLIEHLEDLGWCHLTVSGVTGISNGVAIVSRVPMELRPPPLGPALGPWAVECAIPSLDVAVVGVYAPLANSWKAPPGLQRQFWEAVHRMIDRRRSERVLLVGDFNTGAPGDDGPNAQPCADAFQHLSTLGWIDAWRACNPQQNDFSYVHRFAAGSSNWRIDQAFVSPALAASVSRCRYSQAEREQKLSDHSMLIIEFE